MNTIQPKEAAGSPDREPIRREQLLYAALFADSRDAMREPGLPDGAPLLLCRASGDREALRALREFFRDRDPQPFLCRTETAMALLFAGDEACSGAEAALRAAADAFPRCLFCAGSVFQDVSALPGEYEKLAAFADGRWFFETKDQRLYFAESAASGGGTERAPGEKEIAGRLAAGMITGQKETLE